MSGRAHRAVQHRSALAGIQAFALHTDHSFPRHSHDQFGIGVIETGAHRSWSGIGTVEAGPGDIITVNPGEVHDGAPIGGTARRWRILYLDPVLVRAELREETEAEEIARPAFRDPVLAALFHRLFARVAQGGADPLDREEALLRALHHLFRHHGARRGRPPAAAPAVRAARQRLDEAPERPASLAELAAIAGVSRFQLLRGFRRDVGMTPHAYLLQRRVLLARQLLAQGRGLAEAAQAAGFADQSHMTRAFVRQLGVTPGRYRAALR